MGLEAYREKEAEDQRERGRVQGGVCANNPLVEEDGHFMRSGERERGAVGRG